MTFSANLGLFLLAFTAFGMISGAFVPPPGDQFNATYSRKNASTDDPGDRAVAAGNRFVGSADEETGFAKTRLTVASPDDYQTTTPNILEDTIMAPINNKNDYKRRHHYAANRHYAARFGLRGVYFPTPAMDHSVVGVINKRRLLDDEEDASDDEGSDEEDASDDEEGSDGDDASEDEEEEDEEGEEDEDEEGEEEDEDEEEYADDEDEEKADETAPSTSLPSPSGGSNATSPSRAATCQPTVLLVVGLATLVSVWISKMA